MRKEPHANRTIVSAVVLDTQPDQQPHAVVGGKRNAHQQHEAGDEPGFVQRKRQPDDARANDAVDKVKHRKRHGGLHGTARCTGRIQQVTGVDTLHRHDHASGYAHPPLHSTAGRQQSTAQQCDCTAAGTRDTHRRADWRRLRQRGRGRQRRGIGDGVGE